MKATNLNEMDGRLARSERTKREIVEAYILLLRENPQIPTAAQISQRAGYSVRTIFMHFSDLAGLSVAACDYGIGLGFSAPVGDKASADRQARIHFQVGARSRMCETWLPMWRMLLHYRRSVPELDSRMKIIRSLMYQRLQLMYRPELDSLPEPDRRAVLLALESLTDFESWGRMRENHGLTFEQASEAWITSIDRLLPPTPA